MTAGPKLKWKTMKKFPGEYESSVGEIHFEVATTGQWDISAGRRGRRRLIIIDCGDSKSLTAAKRKCQQWLTRQWKAMEQLKGDAGK